MRNGGGVVIQDVPKLRLPSEAPRSKTRENLGHSTIAATLYDRSTQPASTFDPIWSRHYAGALTLAHRSSLHKITVDANV